MIGKLYSLSRDSNRRDVPAAVVGEGLKDYSCPECGGRQYQLVFRVDALIHRAALIVECGACRIREELQIGSTVVA